MSEMKIEDYVRLQTCYLKIRIRIRYWPSKPVIIIKVKRSGLSDDEFCKARALHVH